MAWITAVHKGETKEIYFDAKDFWKISHKTWSISRQGKMKKPYAISWQCKTESERRKKLWMHRIISDCPEGLVTDHFDGDGLHNCAHNLRNITLRENQQYAYGKMKLTQKKKAEEPWL